MKKYILAFLLFLPLTLLASETISTKGSWKSEIENDMGSITFTISHLDKSSKKAMTLTETKYNQVLNIAKSMNLKDAKFQSKNLSFRDEHEWKKRVKIYKGNRASVDLYVETSDIKKIGELVNKVKKLDLHRIGNLRTFVSNEKRDAEYRKSLKFAVLDAKAKATTMAQALKMKVGKPIQITEGHLIPIAPMQPRAFMAKSMAESEASAPPMDIQAGESSIEVNVSVTFKLK